MIEDNDESQLDLSQITNILIDLKHQLDDDSTILI